MGYIMKGTMENMYTGQLSVVSLELTEVAEVIDGLHLGARALQCMALTFNTDGLVPHAY